MEKELNHDYRIISEKDLNFLKSYMLEKTQIKIFYKFINYKEDYFFDENIKLGFLVLKLNKEKDLVVSKFYNIFDDFLLSERIKNFYHKMNFDYAERSVNNFKNSTKSKSLYNYDLSCSSNIYLSDMSFFCNYNIKQAYDYLRYLFLRKYIISEIKY